MKFTVVKKEKCSCQAKTQTTHMCWGWEDIVPAVSQTASCLAKSLEMFKLDCSGE